MKLWIILFALLWANISFAEPLAHKKSVGKPGVDAFFLDTDVIRLISGQSQTVDIKIKYTADVIDYLVYASDGLTLQELTQSPEITGDNLKGILSIPLQISVNQEGRFYIHIQITAQKDGIETKGVISKVVSSEPIEQVQAMKKQSQPNKIQILPSTETIKKKTDE